MDTLTRRRCRRRRSIELQTYGSQALCLMLGEYLDAIGLIIFYESLPESSYNPIKLIMFCYLLKVRGTGYREATHLIGPQ